MTMWEIQILYLEIKFIEPQLHSFTYMVSGSPFIAGVLGETETIWPVKSYYLVLHIKNGRSPGSSRRHVPAHQADSTQSKIMCRLIIACYDPRHLELLINS